MKQLSSIVLTLIFLLLFNYASASIVNTAIFNDSSEEAPQFQLGSHELNGDTENLGRIVLDSMKYNLTESVEPIKVELDIGTLYVIGHIPDEGYVFDHWEIEGGKLQKDKRQQANLFEAINNSGSIIAVYRKIEEEIVTTTITETIEEYELPLGKFISLSIHEIIEEHKENISFWIFEHKLLVLQKDADKLNAIEDYQEDIKQEYLRIKEEMRELEENLTNGIITEDVFTKMRILEIELSRIRNSNEKLGHILGDISKEFSEELRKRVEERKRIHSEFKEELNVLKEEIKIMKTKTKILKTAKTIHTETTKTPPGQTKKTTTTKTKEDKGKGKD